MKVVGARLQAVAAALVLLLAAGQQAAAQTCNFSITSLNFGSIDVTANTAFTTTGTYSASCSALLSATRTCPSIGEGTGGSSSGSPRYLVNGSNQLAFNLFSDSSFSTIWGSEFWGFPYTPPPTDIGTILLGNGNTSRTVYARIPNGQQTLPAGTYTSSFAGAETRITYAAYLAGLFPPDCATLSSPAGTAPFTVTATISANCAVSATTLDFGTTGTIASNQDSTNGLSITCTSGTPYSVALDGGTSGASDPTQRLMKSGSESVLYGLYRDASRSQPWGSSTGVNTVSGTGTGLPQSLTVYGRVAPHPTPGPGTYRDTIVVTVTY